MPIFSIQSKRGLSIQILTILSALLIVFAAALLDRNDTNMVLLFWFTSVVLWVTLVCYSAKALFLFFFLIAFFLRVIVWLIFPGLSDDIYRFIWDGALWMEGGHPFSLTPDAYMHITDTTSYLLEATYPQLNSPAYHTVYPAVGQAFFALGAGLFPEDLYLAHLVIKLPLLIGEGLNLWIIMQLVKHGFTGKKWFVAYAMQPFIVLEGVGNAHFEILMLTPLLLLLLYYQRASPRTKGSLLALGASVKLLPTLLLPLLFWKTKASGKWWLVLVFGLLFTTLHFYLFSPYELLGFASSIDLYFRHFEFNASLYFVVREISTFFLGYNAIAYTGPLLALTGLVVILFISYKIPVNDAKDLAGVMVLILTVYFLCSTTVHPWYIITLAGLSVLKGWYFPWIWLCTAWLTYIGYSSEGYEENWLVIIIQYGAVFIALYFDLKRNNQYQKPRYD
jgi:alpha-1,6-mannosyltransferase